MNSANPTLARSSTNIGIAFVVGLSSLLNTPFLAAHYSRSRSRLLVTHAIAEVDLDAIVEVDLDDARDGNLL